MMLQHFSVEFLEKKITKFLKRSAIWSKNFAFIRCRHATYLQNFWILFFGENNILSCTIRHVSYKKVFQT